MALITCKDCGEQVSSSAGACPKCGRPQPYSTQSINRTGFWIVALFVVGYLLSCSQGIVDAAFLEENASIGGPADAAPNGIAAEFLYPFVLFGNLMTLGSIAWGAATFVGLVRSRR